MGEYSILTLIDQPPGPVKIEILLPDGRLIDLRPSGALTRDEAHKICNSIMNCMRAGLRADQFRHGRVLREERAKAENAGKKGS